MPVLSGSTNVNENATATGDVTDGSTTITRLLAYTNRSGVVVNNTPIPVGGLTVDTFYGTLTIQQNGNYTYVAQGPNAEALDTGGMPNEAFSYDFGVGDASDDGTTTVYVTGINDAPVGVADGYSIGEDGGTLTVAAPGVLGNDTDVDDPTPPTQANLVSGTTNGVLAFNPDGSFSYTPNSNFNGTDTFTYRPFDGEVQGNLTTVTITVTADATTADPYIAVDDGSDPAPAGTGGGFTPFITQNEDATVTYNIGTVGGPIGNGNFLSNDQNPDGETIVVQSISNLFDAATGVLVGTITYDNVAQTYTIDPNDNYNGAAYFDYVAATTQNTPTTADDQVDQGRVYVTITSVNDAPTLGDGAGPGTTDGVTSATGTEDAVINGAVPAASDNVGSPSENNTPITYQLVPGSVMRNGGSVGDGTITFNSNGTYSYNPTANPIDQGLDTGESNVITFQYRAVDSLGGVSAAAPGTITVNGVNDAPDAVNDTFAGTEGAILNDPSMNLRANDTDVDGETLQVTPETKATTQGGQVTINSDGTFTYTPPGGVGGNFTGPDTFTYTVRDSGNDGIFQNGDDLTDSATVTINVGNTADAPVAADDNRGPVTEDVPNQGGFNEAFQANLTEANGYFRAEDLLANDTDPDDTTPPLNTGLTVTGVGAAQHGTVTLRVIDPIDGPARTYAVFTPDANYAGPAQFDYAVTDPEGNSDIGTVRFSITSVADGPPVAVDDTVGTLQEGSATDLVRPTLTINASDLLANDTDPDNGSVPGPNPNPALGTGGNTLYLKAVQNLQNLEVVSYTYNTAGDPNSGIKSFVVRSTTELNNATYRFDYVVDDELGTNVTGTDIGTVTVTVAPQNDNPTDANETLSGIVEDSTTGRVITQAELLAGANDPDFNAGNAGFTVSNVSVSASQGTITNNGDGTWTYRPAANFNGNASISYTVTDTNGGTDTSVATIPVAAVNDNPVAVDDTLTRTVTVGQPLITEDRDSVFSFDQFLANDSDVDIARGEGGQAPLFISGATSDQGTITLDQVNRLLIFHPTPGYNGPATIEYTVSDQQGGTDTGVASFTILDTVVGGGTGENLSGNVVYGNGGNDVLNGTPQTDELYGGDGNDTMNGFGSNDFLRGGTGNDTGNGGDGNDTIYMDDGGSDTANGDAGNDGLFFGATFEDTDVANGGSGSDTLALRGNYGTGIGANSDFLSATNLVGIETLLLASGTNTTTFPAPGGTTPPPAGGFDYYFTSQDANVAAGQILTIVSGSPSPGVNGLQAGEDLYFDGSDEKDGSFRFFLGEGNDRLIGGQMNDGFFFATGAFTSADQVDGRGGTDTLALRGDYSGGVTLTNMVNTEIVSLLSGHTNQFGGPIVPGGYDYNITLATGNVSAGQTLQVNGANLGADETMTVNGNQIFGGNLTIFGGAANDDLSGGTQTTPVFGTGGTDLLIGGLGGDTMDGGSSAGGSGFGTGFDGSNVYLYRAANESNGSQTGIDHIQGFNYQVDKIDINAGGPATNGIVGGIAGLNVTDVNAVFSGTFTDTNAIAGLQDSEFFTQLATQLDTALNPGQAAFLQVTSGIAGYAGSTIFVADTNGNGSVDSSDLIIVFDNLQGQLPPSPEFII
jgi:VCBS repeat-containing protein